MDCHRQRRLGDQLGVGDGAVVLPQDALSDGHLVGSVVLAIALDESVEDVAAQGNTCGGTATSDVQLSAGPDNRDYVIDKVTAVWNRYGILGG